ncbi:IF-2-associated domain-containing protein, partial [Stenotrophomonas maltophilia]
DVITESDKTRLLDYLKRAHGSAEDGARKKITITKRETSEIRQADATGKTRTVQVEVKKKRVLVKRDEPNAAQAESEAAEAAPVVDAEEVARREEEHRRQAELLARQEAELKARQEAMEREEAERRARQEAAEAE